MTNPAITASASTNRATTEDAMCDSTNSDSAAAAGATGQDGMIGLHADTTIWTDVGRLDDIPRPGARVVTTPAIDIAVFRTADDQVFALHDRCPHKGGKLSQGIVHGHAVTCPLHNWVIDLAAGKAKDPDEGCARSVPVRLQDGCILLAVGSV